MEDQECRIIVSLDIPKSYGAEVAADLQISVPANKKDLILSALHSGSLKLEAKSLLTAKPLS